MDGAPLLDRELSRTMSLNVGRLPTSIDYRQNFVAAAGHLKSLTNNDNEPTYRTVENLDTPIEIAKRGLYILPKHH